MRDDTNKMEKKLVDYIQDAHAMETDVLAMLKSMISTTTDPEIKGQLEHHLEETKGHQRRMEECLKNHGATPSVRKEAQTLIAALAKGTTDKIRTDKPGKNARDGFVTEHMEIAAYELLERLALRAGDMRTVEAARAIKAEEHAMAERIDANWDRFIELTLQEAEILV
ncbi:MAG: uncharacterized protein JWM25_616 [Thermoleophilia bacterium]|nr:uncharacterized protein [Thermoleophilia bacterium]MCZ4496033.1 uncharacterized protein [Thermoleophilia bacterium]